MRGKGGLPWEKKKEMGRGDSEALSSLLRRADSEACQWVRGMGRSSVATQRTVVTAVHDTRG